MGRKRANLRALLVIPSVLKRGIESAVAAGQHPRMDYWALADGLTAAGVSVDFLDFADLRARRSGRARLATRVNHDTALALLAARRLSASHYDIVFTNSESVSLPLSLLLRQRRAAPPRHVTIAHRVSTKRKHVFFKQLQAWREIDVMFVYASTQERYAVDQLGVPSSRVRRIAFHADTRFFTPQAQIPESSALISAAGLEWRDYPTLIDAVASNPELSVRLAAASPWSKHANETQKRVLPAHVDARRYEYDALRDLYAASAMVAVPLYQNDFQAGVTTLLEAMAVGKPVIVTRTHGQTDVIEDTINGLYVEPGDISGWQTRIERLRQDDSLRRRLGQAARAWVESYASLDNWVAHVCHALIQG